MVDCELSDNEAETGAALSSEGGVLYLSSVTVADNNGDSVLNFAGLQASLTSVTVSNNDTPLGTTIVVGAITTAEIRSSTIASNNNIDGTITNFGTLQVRTTILDNVKNCNANGTAPVDLGNNLESGGVSCGFPTGSTELGALGHYGSRVRTLPISATSAARGAGIHCAGEDGRGFRRPAVVGAPCDIGAFEYDGPLALTVTNVNDAGPGSLRQALADIGFGGTITFNLPGSRTILIDSGLGIGRPMTLDGSAAGVTIQRNPAAGAFQLLQTGFGQFCGPYPIEIRDITFRDGDAGGAPGGAILNCATLTGVRLAFTGQPGHRRVSRLHDLRLVAAAPSNEILEQSRYRRGSRRADGGRVVSPRGFFALVRRARHPARESP
jgi:hypothetical protein